MDLFSRQIVGWFTGPAVHRELVLNPVLLGVPWRRFCRSNRLRPSVSRKGNRWDNAVAESFLKQERIKKHIYTNRDLAFNDVANYIETFYSRTRRHSHLGGLSPEQFEAAHRPRRPGVH
jgi:putative transposase